MVNEDFIGDLLSIFGCIFEYLPIQSEHGAWGRTGEIISMLPKYYSSEKIAEVTMFACKSM